MNVSGGLKDWPKEAMESFVDGSTGIIERNKRLRCTSTN